MFGAYPSFCSRRKAIGDSNVVINMLGRDFETHRYRFEDVNIEAAQRIASASAELGVKRLIHFSALGAASVPHFRRSSLLEVSQFRGFAVPPHS